MQSPVQFLVVLVVIVIVDQLAFEECRKMFMYTFFSKLVNTICILLFNPLKCCFFFKKTLHFYIKILY